MTVHETISLLKGSVNATVPEDTVDTIKLGDPDMEVTGIVTCFIATPAVFREAVRLGANLIITHEPTFYEHHDTITWQSESEVYRRKLELAKESGVALWRFHDLSHMNQPDLIMTGMENALGWSAFRDAQSPWLFHLPATTLRTLAEEMKSALDAASVRLVGRDDLPVRHVAFLMGGCPGEIQLEILLKEVDVLIAGETCEWMVCEYVRDADQLGIDLGMAVFGHRNTEEEGMRHVASWVGGLLPGVPVAFVPSGDPFRSL